MPNRLVPAALAAAIVALAPAGVQAQEERTSALPNYSLVQLSVDPDKVPADEFRAKLETVRSCNDAVKAGAAIGAGITRNDYVRASALPPELAAILERMPSGQPTPMFSGRDGQLRVLVICGRT